MQLGLIRIKNVPPLFFMALAGGVFAFSIYQILNHTRNLPHFRKNEEDAQTWLH